MNKNNVKISIIIPIYNTEQYIQQCLNSIVNQTLQDIEIICVNDGSTDNSLKIIEQYAKKDTRIKVVTQKNKGQSAARNAGLNIANGEYIGFVDSDDFIEPNMYEKLYKNAVLNNSDVAMCSIKVLEPDKTYNTNDSYFSLKIFDKNFDNRTFSYLDCKNFLFRICVVPWNKIYKRSFLQTNSIYFIPKLNFEDNVFTLDVLLKSKKISLIRDSLIIYRRLSNTSLTTHEDEKKLDLFKVLKEQEKLLQKNKEFYILNNYFYRHKKNTLEYWYKKIKDEKVKQQYQKQLLNEYNY